VKRTVLLLLCALTVACVSHDGPFTAIGTPAMPLHEARPHCKEKAHTVADDGSVDTDWKAYERCMEDLGWVKQVPASSGGMGPGVGGQPSY
jgi:hypothetical protein